MKAIPLLFAALLTHGCTRTPLGDPAAPLPAALVPPTGASDIQKAVFPGHAAEVHYTLTVAYPAPEVVSDIQRRVLAAGFTPEAEDLFNPGLRSGTGWGSYLDRSQSVHAAMHQWNAWWKNAAGDYVGYVLWYRSSPYSGDGPPSAPTTTKLEVTGQFLTREEASLLRSRLPTSTKSGA